MASSCHFALSITIAVRVPRKPGYSPPNTDTGPAKEDSEALSTRHVRCHRSHGELHHHHSCMRDADFFRARRGEAFGTQYLLFQYSSKGQHGHHQGDGEISPEMQPSCRLWTRAEDYDFFEGTNDPAHAPRNQMHLQPRTWKREEVILSRDERWAEA